MDGAPSGKELKRWRGRRNQCFALRHFDAERWRHPPVVLRNTWVMEQLESRGLVEKSQTAYVFRITEAGQAYLDRFEVARTKMEDHRHGIQG